ncbi:uncharacterized protein LOC122137193 [Cyprinus carpio]|uniref:Uncharacterized protein LOC122137193 n=1 Tax=Cyprinus carpio TaxID=7962 RepID=A0A9Q9ZYN8_CYPCA|nr:uncharacterized protein LOC122137193 [Cyprinus carpio]
MINISYFKGKSVKQKMSGKKKQYSKEKLKEAAEEVKAGASLRATAKKKGIPHITLQDYIKNKYVHTPQPNLALTPGEEEVLLSFIFWMSDHGFPVTRSLVKVLAVGIIKERGRTETTTVNLEKGPSDVWWSRFKAHHPELASRTADSLDRARGHQSVLQSVRGPLCEAQAGEQASITVMRLALEKPCSREKVLSQNGRKHVYQQQQTTREHITVHCCVNAAGDSIPPFKAGICPLSRAAVDTTQLVRVLPSADGSEATPSITSPTDTSTITQTPCPTCNFNRVANKNDLMVAAGVISEGLAWRRR